MFIRQKQQSRKTYYSLEERTYDSETKKTKTRMIAGLGNNPRGRLHELLETGVITRDDFKKFMIGLPEVKEPYDREITIKELLTIKDFIEYPWYCRGQVWDSQMKALYIQTLIYGYLSSPIYLYSLDNGNYWVIDGKQRLETIYAFINNKFKISKRLSEHHSLRPENHDDLVGKKFKDLSDEQGKLIMDYVLGLCIYTRRLPKEKLGRLFLVYNSGLGIKGATRREPKGGGNDSSRDDES